jgi:hypothetical protein
MKLLRLLSVNETESDYVAQFQEPIDIQPNSKIALQQISFTLNPNFISVTQDNNVFYLLSSRFPNINVPYGYFELTPNNYDFITLIAELRNKLSAGLIDPLLDSEFANSKTTMEMTAYIDPTNSVRNIEYAISSLKVDENITFKGITNDAETPPSYFKDETYESDWGGAYTTAPFSTGQGYIETYVDKGDGDYDGNGICVGVFPLTATFLQPSPNFTPIIFKYAIFSFQNTYHYISSENDPVDTGVDVIDGDKLIMTQGRNVEDDAYVSGVSFFVARDNGDGTYANPELLHRFVSSYELLLHAGFSLTGEGRIKGFKYSPTAFANQTEDGVSLVDNIDDIQAHSYLRFNGGTLGASPNDQYGLRFTLGSQFLLGFPSIATEFKSGLTANWTGTTNMYNLAIPSALVVEIPNLPLVSYDSYIHRRRPILAVIPSKDLELNNDTITYTPNYPVFIDINNKYQELLNTLRIRMVSTNNKPLNIKPQYGCDISVLLD